MKTRKQWIRVVIAVALFGAFGIVGASPAVAQSTTTTTVTKKTRVATVTKSGWWIRIDTQKTVASAVSFQIGMTRADRHDWRTWTAGEPAEFDVPIELRNLPKLHVRGISEPHKKDAVFCVFYRDHGVEHFKFDGDEDHNMRQSDSTRHCTP